MAGRNMVLGAVAGALVVYAGAVPASSAPAAATKAATYQAPRTSFGQPDLAGFWSSATLTPLTRDHKLGDRLVLTPAEVKFLEQDEETQIAAGNKATDPNAPVNAPNGLELKPSFAAAGGDVGGYNRGWLDPGHTVMRVGGQPRSSILITPDGQVPKRTNGTAAPVNEYGGEGSRSPLGSFDNVEERPLGERCIAFGRNVGPPMLPNGFYNNDYYIVQTPKAVVIEVEMVHDVRVVPLNARHRTDGLRPWAGDSIGWWEGDTLVVETTNFPQAQAFNGSWKNLKITERFTRTAKDRLRYRFTVSDPDTWAEPWSGEYEFSPLHGIIYEYACHEGNYALPGILAGGLKAEQTPAVPVAAKAPGG
jgi:hypothetical protein